MTNGAFDPNRDSIPTIFVEGTAVGSTGGISGLGGILDEVRSGSAPSPGFSSDPNGFRIFNRHSPSLIAWPLQNNRTGWQPVSLPLILVVPHRRTDGGTTVSNTGVTNLRFFIEDAPDPSIVAGVENKGILVPQVDLFSRTISASELAAAQILPEGQIFTDALGNTLDKSIGDEGDFLQYTIMRGWGNSTAPGPTARISFLPDANYYDLSEFALPTGDDLPIGAYNFAYEVSYLERVVSEDNEFICIRDEEETKRLTFPVKHPGDVHNFWADNTPSLYFTQEGGTRREDSEFLRFMRPFADALQDTFDEQGFIDGINHVSEIPAQFIPYLSFLLGWDLPFFPGASDNIRRAVLRNARALQQLKGARRVLRELFDIFGFVVDITNLWYRSDGKALVAPGESPGAGFEDDEITQETVCQTDALIADYDEDGFGEFNIPLLFRPSSNITITGYIVEDGSDAFQFLNNLVNAEEPTALEQDFCTSTIDGFQISPVELSIPSSGIAGFSRVLVNLNGEGTLSVSNKESVISENTVSLDPETSQLSVNFDHFIQFSAASLLSIKKKLFLFATYERTKIVVPPSLSNLRSNRFDIIIRDKEGEFPDSQVLEFLLDFVFQLKAFHSLLRKLSFTITLPEVYNVIDYCVGGENLQKPGTDAGELQTIPPIEPEEVSCDSAATNRGFKSSDLALRNAIIKGLVEEHDTWKNLDGTHDIPDNLLPIVQSLSRVAVRLPSGSSGAEGPCAFNEFGQNAVKEITDDDGNIIKDFDHSSDNREQVCDLEKNKDDLCFTGRVQQDLDTESVIPLAERLRCTPCNLMMGRGAYWLGDLVNDFKTGAIDHDDIDNLRLSDLSGDLIRNRVGTDKHLFYTDRDSFLDDYVESNDFVAINKPSLEIQKDNMHFPGHRFISMANLETDFVHPTYKQRPWDEDIQCDPPLFDLNASLVDDSLSEPALENDLVDPGLIAVFSKNENLTFDSMSYTVIGNGRPADVSSLGDHAITIDPVTGEPQFITHAVFSSAGSGPVNDEFLSTEAGSDVTAMTSDAIFSIIDHDGVVFTEAQSICFNESLQPIFKSANTDCQCPSDAFIPNATEATGEASGADFIDGYPAETGEFEFDPDEFSYFSREYDNIAFHTNGIMGFTFNSDTPDLLPHTNGMSGFTLVGFSDVDLNELLDLPITEGTGNVSARYRLGSGILVAAEDPQFRFYEPFRLDCECLVFDECALSTGSDITSGNTEVGRCNIELFRNDDGFIDTNCDRVDTDITMILSEAIGMCSFQLDGTIPNLMCFDPDKIDLPFDEKFPPTGSFKFVDDYGIIHEAEFEVSGNRIDITFQTSDPRPPDGIQSGFIKNRKVFRRGVITKIRQLLELTDTGFNIIAEGSEQFIDTFQTTFGCGDDPLPEDPFAFHLDCAATDDLEIEVIGGTGTGTDTTGTE